jgi:hypothetical protein
MKMLAWFTCREHWSNKKRLTLCGVFSVWWLDNSVNRTTLLAEAAVDALCHVEIVTSGSSTSVLTLLGLNGNGLCRADGFTQLAGNASLFTGRVAAQGVLATETRADGTLLERVVDGVTFEPINNWADVQVSNELTHGGLKNCSRTMYMPRIISVSRK